MRKAVEGIAILLVSALCWAEKTEVIDPKSVRLNDHVHASLPPALLTRIKATTDIFESIDGITYEQAVDLYRRDFDPESNLVIFEEMARVYKSFCKSRCKTPAEKKDVYKALLIRSMYTEEQALTVFKPQAISPDEAKFVIRQYRLASQPIGIYKK